MPQMEMYDSGYAFEKEACIKDLKIDKILNSNRNHGLH